MLGIGLLLQSSAVLAAGQPAESLELTLKLVQQHGYYAAKVDWPKISSEARARAQSKNEDSAIHSVLSALGDGHCAELWSAHRWVCHRKHHVQVAKRWQSDD